MNMNNSYEVTRNDKLFDWISPKEKKKGSILKSNLKIPALLFKVETLSVETLLKTPNLKF